MHLSVSFTDVFALKTKKQMIVLCNDEVKVIHGHEKFVWIRNGFIFKTIGAGYVGLNIVNDLRHGDPPFAKRNLVRLDAGAAVFLLRELFHRKFDPYLHIGKKYKLEYIALREKEDSIRSKQLKTF